MFRRILVPVDGSAPSDRALELAVGIAKESRARLRVIHIIDPLPPASIDGMYTEIDAYREAMIASGRAVIRRAQKRLGTAKRVESELLETIGHDVSSAILVDARRWRADLIVLGTNGRTGLARLFLGSVAEGVVRHSPIAVLLVRRPARRRAR